MAQKAPAIKLPVYRRYWPILLIAAILSGLDACGFHLRGKLQLDERYLPIYVEDLGENAEVKPRLIRLLTESEIPVMENGDGHLRILIDKLFFEKRLISADDEANIDTYDVGIRLRYKFKLDGEEILSWQDLRVNRTLQFSKSAVVSSATEEVTLRDDLLSEAVNQIVTRLRYLDTLISESRANIKKPEEKKDGGPNKIDEVKDEPKT